MKHCYFTLLAMTLCMQTGYAQEKAMRVQKTDSTSTFTRVAEIDKVSFLNVQGNTMYVHTTNGNIDETDVAEVEDITFVDTLYNINASGDRILEYDQVCWPDDRLLPVFLPPATIIRSVDMPALNLSSEERIMLCALQGIVNRTRPRLLLYNHNEEPRATWPTAHNLKHIGALSSAYLAVKYFVGEVRGLVLYSTEKSNHYANLAATVAGLERALPVTETIRQKLVSVGIDLPVLEDFTSLTYTTPLSIYNYMYNKYWSRCNHRLLVSLSPTIPYVHDIAAAAGSAVVWLDPRVSSEKVLLDKMLKDMKPGRDFVLGWYPEERSGVGEATRYGLSTVPADFFENTTIYSAVSAPINIPAVPKRQKLENKVYATVYISDGDNIQYCQHAMAKIYGQSGRGKMPMNWTISPALAEFSPQMLNYYYGKATQNDCFVSGPSGMGYAMPYDAHNARWNTATYSAFVPYAKLTQRYLEKAGLRVVTIWDEVNASQRKAYADECPYLYGLTIQDWERQAGRLQPAVQSGRLPFVPNYPCYANGVDVITDFFNRDIKNFKGDAPMFVSGQVTVWDAGPDKLVALTDRLDALSPGNVEIVRADHFFNLYCEANHLPFDLTMTEAMQVTSSASLTNADVAADGSPSQKNMWVSATADHQGWVQMDFGEPYLISRYVVRHAQASGMGCEFNTRDFTVETSEDGIVWNQVGAHANNIQAVTDVEIEPVQARYVRVTVTNAGEDGVARIGDLEVYGSH